MRHAPPFWSNPSDVRGWCLQPFGLIYAGASWLRRLFIVPQNLQIPVICVGNIVAGGAGKTPTALALAIFIQKAGFCVHFLSRGYGGSVSGPIRVDPAQHGAELVGDEALLLAAQAPCWVARDRRASGQAAVAAGAEILIMDDGLQNPGLFQDLGIVVEDAGFGLGNGRLIPAGPLREPVAQALKRAHMVLIIDKDFMGSSTRTIRSVREFCTTQFVLTAKLLPEAGFIEKLRASPIVCFAGIGRPENFFAMLKAQGCDLQACQIFPDHHPLTKDQLKALRTQAEQLNALLVTTEKDFVRLPRHWRTGITPVPVSLCWDDLAALKTILAPLLAYKAMPK